VAIAAAAWETRDVGHTFSAGERSLHEAQQALLAGSSTVPTARTPRSLVRSSWERSAGFGLDPGQVAPLALDDAALDLVRAQHPLHAAMPVVRRLLVEQAVAEDMVVAVSDAGGRLLWVEGHRGVRRRAETVHFTAGAWWDERHAGTSAPGLALQLDRPAVVDAGEHWATSVQSFSCSAAPVHDPRTGVLLGALDLTGGGQAASGLALGLVRATVAAVEQHLLLTPAGSPGRRTSGSDAPEGRRLRVLGADGGRWADGEQLHLRHAELLLLLHEHPEGCSGEELALALDERDLDPVTVRAEVHRLRRVLGQRAVVARPYRLTVPLRTDLDDVRWHLDGGRVAAALSAYSGPVLPRSLAPGVVALREAVELELRVALLQAGDPTLLLAWVRDAGHRHDVGLWRAALAGLEPGARRDRAAGLLVAVEREVGLRA